MSDSNPPEVPEASHASEEGIKIEIPLTGSDHPTDPKAQRYKGLASLLIAAAAFITAMAAIFKPQDKTDTKATYNELKAAVEQNSREDQQNHDDLIALRNYLDGYFKGEGRPIALPPISSASSSSTATALLVPIDRNRLHDAGTQIALVVPTASAPPLPTIRPVPTAQKLPDFDSLMKEK